MKRCLINVVEGRYRCWADFLRYGMVSAGHNNPPGAPLKGLSVGDEIYVFLNTRGYVGRGEVTRAAVLADQFAVFGDFIAKDWSGSITQVRLDEIIGLGRSDMTNDAKDPLIGEWVIGVKWLSTCPREKPKKFDGMQEPRGTVEELTDQKTERFLMSNFGT